ncbi:MAG TPA: hypothetical protein VNL94_01035 [Candidatus Binatia bacterium]|nr:hypothetical protein [Candidatus Binatia bacterium]
MGLVDWPPPPEAAAGKGWPPESGSSSGELLAGVPWAALTLTNAFEAAFRGLAKPALIGPILLISCLVNVFLEAIVTPGIMRTIRVTPSGVPSVEDVDQLLLLAAISFVVTLLGGILVAVYGQVWAAAASRGPLPNLAAASELAGRRWVSLVGASIVVSLVVIAAVLGLMVVVLAVVPRNAAAALLVVIPFLAAFVWLNVRLSMATWLAADGSSVEASLRGTWRITRGNMLRILAWSLATGIAFALLSGGLGAILRVVPLIGGGIAQGISYALTYGAQATLFRRTLAASTAAEPGTGTPIG